MDWQLQDAKNRFSKVVREAQTVGPQFVTLRGARTAVVLSASDYEALYAGRPTLVDDLLSGPAWDEEVLAAIDARAATPGRDVAF